MTAFAVFLLSFFAEIRRKAVSGIGCRSPPANLDFQKIQIGGNENVIQLWQRRKEMAALERSRGKAVEGLGR
jgi:hypothetical protein